MASLQDQLLKAGLVKKNKANQLKKEQQKQTKAQRKMGGKTVNEARLAAQQEQQKKLDRDRELNREKQNELDRKAWMAQIKQLILLNRIDRGDGEVAYSFVHNDKVKKIQVNEKQQKQLSTGNLAIVNFVQAGQIQYELVPRAVAEKITQRDAASIVQINVMTEDDIGDDDPYAGYQIPDDLMW